MIKRVLIVDDDEIFCEELACCLRREDFSVDTAYDGLEGRSLIYFKDYDILLLDLKLPELSGLDILKIVKLKRKNMKVVVISGEEYLKDLIEGDALKQADGVLWKPFDVPQLLEMLH